MYQTSLTQRQRFLAFFFNLMIFYAFYVWATGHYYLTGGGETLWLASAVGWWTLGLISAPWYRPPRDAMGAAVAAALALITLELPTSNTTSIYALRLAAISYAIVVAVAALTAALVGRESNTPFSRFCYLLAERLSNGPFLFGTAALISIFGYYSNPNHLLILTSLWLAFALIKPFELLIALLEDWRTEQKVGELDVAGNLVRVDDPNIARVSIEDSIAWGINLHVACIPGGGHRYIIPLFSHIQDNQTIGTGYITSEAPTDSFPDVVGRVFSLHDPDKSASLVEQLSGRAEGSFLVGFVVEGSDISEIRFEVSGRAILEEGTVIFCKIGDCPVYYQVISANTAEESFQQNPRGTHIVTATQLGQWSPDQGFLKFSWLPQMNTPIFGLGENAEYLFNINNGEFYLGKVPSSPIKIKGDLPKMIAYHTAILGVTGTGKTELVFDLIEEAIKQGTKVICVDLTGEYRRRLLHLEPHGIGLRKNKADELEKKLFAVETGRNYATEEKKTLKAFLDSVRGEAKGQISNFLSKAGSALAIFELAEVTNTRATLMATEMFLSEIMLWARANRKARRILIVLEEAHTIIPETSGSGFDYGTQSIVSKIGQIALQGRKYGVDLFIVSQRTALVSKTVLSQCNTFLTHSLVDETSLKFLLNIYESSYVKAIPNLKFLQFIAHGKGVVSERPLLIAREHSDKKAEASAKLDDFHSIDDAIEPKNASETAAKSVDKIDQPKAVGGDDAMAMPTTEPKAKE